MKVKFIIWLLRRLGYVPGSIFIDDRGKKQIQDINGTWWRVGKKK